MCIRENEQPDFKVQEMSCSFDFRFPWSNRWVAPSLQWNPVRVSIHPLLSDTTHRLCLLKQNSSIRYQRRKAQPLSADTGAISGPLWDLKLLLILENSMGSISNISQTISFHSNTCSSNTRLFFSHLHGFSSVCMFIPDVLTEGLRSTVPTALICSLSWVFKLSRVKCNTWPSKVSLLIRKLYSTISEKIFKKVLGSSSHLNAEASLPRIKAE